MPTGTMYLPLVKNSLHSKYSVNVEYSTLLQDDRIYVYCDGNNKHKLYYLQSLLEGATYKYFPLIGSTVVMTFLISAIFIR